MSFVNYEDDGVIFKGGPDPTALHITNLPPDCKSEDGAELKKIIQSHVGGKIHEIEMRPKKRNGYANVYFRDYEYTPADLQSLSGVIFKVLFLYLSRRLFSAI